jgi:hypothetical protein
VNRWKRVAAILLVCRYESYISKRPLDIPEKCSYPSPVYQCSNCGILDSAHLHRINAIVRFVCCGSTNALQLMQVSTTEVESFSLLYSHSSFCAISQLVKLGISHSQITPFIVRKKPIAITISKLIGRQYDVTYDPRDNALYFD